MVVDALNDFASSAPIMLVGGLVLTLAGIQHIFAPGSSLIVELFQMLEISGGGIELLARAVGVGVAGAGVGQLGNALEMLGVY